MTNELEKQFFDTFGIEPIDNFKGCESGITFYTYGCNMPSCKGCSKEIRQKDYPQITDTHYLKLISIMSKELSIIVNLLSEDIQELKSEILDKCIRNYHRHKEAFSKAHREYADDFKHQVRTLFEEG